MPTYNIRIDIIDVHKEGSEAVNPDFKPSDCIVERHWFTVQGADIHVNIGEIYDQLLPLLERYSLLPRFSISEAVRMFLGNKYRWYVLYAEPAVGSPLTLSPYYEMRINKVEEIP